MGLLSKIKRALKTKDDDKKKKNVKTYVDNPMLKTKKKETANKGNDTKSNTNPSKKDTKKPTKPVVKTYTDNPALKTKGTGDTFAQHRTKQKAISELKKAQKSKEAGNTKLYDEHTEKARTYKNQYTSMKSTEKKGYENLTKNEMAVLQTAMLTGNMDYASKVIRNAENGAYTRDDKVRNEYANMGRKIGGQYQYSVDTNAGLQGFLQGSGWVSIKHVQEQLAGSPINSTGDQTGMYNVGNIAGTLAQAGTAIPNIAGQSVKAAFKVGAKQGLKALGKNAVRTAIAELPVNVTSGLKEATEKADAGKEIPSVLDDTNLSTDEAEGGVLYTENREAGFSAKDAEGTTSINNWNNDLIAQAWDRAEKLDQQPIFGVDKNGMLHYSFSKVGLANILEYYNQTKDPTYALESTKKEYKGSFGNDFIKSALLNTAMSAGAGSVLSGIGKGTKGTIDNAENIAPKASEAVTEGAIKAEPPKNTLNPNRKTVKNKSKTEDAAFRAGKTEGNHKADTLNSMRDRDTGHFGTGTYFVGDRKIIKDYNKKDPRYKLDVSGYNLYKPKDAKQGMSLHNALKDINRKLDRHIGSKEVDTEKLLDNFEIDDYNKLPEWYQRKIESKAKDIMDDYKYRHEKMANMSDAEIEAEAKKYVDEFAKDMDRMGVKMEEAEKARMLTERISEIKDTKNNPKALSEEEAIKRAMNGKLRDEIIDGVNEDKALKDNLLSEAKYLFPDKSEKEISDAVDKTINYAKTHTGDETKLDSYSTYLMKELGYDGVDVRGIKELDNTRYGSVIYDYDKTKKAEYIDKEMSKPKGKLRTKGEKAKNTELPKAEKPKAKEPEKVGSFEVTTAPKKSNSSMGIVPDGSEVIQESVSKVKQAGRTGKKLFISGQEPLERMAKDINSTKVLDRIQAVRNARESVSYYFHKGVVSVKQGKIIRNKGFKDALVVNGKKPSKDLKKAWNTYATHLHNIDRSKQYVYKYTTDTGAVHKVQATSFDDAASKFESQGIDIYNIAERNNGDFMNLYNLNLKDGVGKFKNLEVESKAVYRKTSAAESQKIVDDLLKKHPELETMQKQVDEWWNDFAYVNFVESGFMTEKQFKDLRKMYPHYVPTYREQVPLGAKVTGGNKYPLKEAVGGNSKVAPLEDQFVTEMDRLIKLSRKNEMMGEFIKELQANPNETKFYGAVKSTKGGEPKYPDIFLEEWEKNAIGEIKNDVATITAYIDGEKVTASVSKEVAEAFQLLDEAYGWKGLRTISEIGKKATNPLKTGITGINPLFGIANIARDLPTAFVQSNYPMHKTFTGLFKAMTGMVGSKLGKGTGYAGLYNMYKGLGGKTAGYFNQGKGFVTSVKGGNPAQQFWSGVKDVLSVIGETGETVPRLAEFINTIEKYGTTPEAYTKALRDAAEVTVNFSRSAPITKSLDAWVLYLNATVQGLDKFARTMKAHPVKTAVRSTAMISAPFFALTAHNWDNPYYQDLSDRVKANYFCIPNIRGEKDAAGNPMTFIKVPLNREYGTIFGTSLNLAFAKFKDGDMDSAISQMGESFKTNFLPQNPVTDNIAAPILINLPSNKDFAGRPIIPANLEKVSPYLQYDANTSEAAMLMASKINELVYDGESRNPLKNNKLVEILSSPKKVDYLLDSYGGYLGTVIQSIGDKNVDGVWKYMVDTFGGQLDERFLSDSRFSSKPINDFYTAKTEAEIAYNDAKLLDSDDLEYKKKINTIYTNASSSMSDMSKAEKKLLEYDDLSAKDKKDAATTAFELLGDGVINKDVLKQLKGRKGNLSEDDIDRLIKGLRTTKNNLAKTVPLDVLKFEKEYNNAPTFAVLSDDAKESYKKSYGSKEKYAKVYNLVHEKTKDDKDKYSMSGKITVAIENGMSEEAAYALSGSTAKKENFAKSYNKAKEFVDSGLDLKKAEKIKKKANVDKNSSTSKDEAIAAINKYYPNASSLQKRVLFNAICTTGAKNPY